VNIDGAYAACERITATEARNFSYGIKLLPAPKRRAMSALYALARRIDDIGDGDGPPSAKLEALAEARKQVAELRADRPTFDPDDPVMTAVADVAARFPLPVSALEELIEGCEMDVSGQRYETIDDLVGYCRRVAGTVGRLSLAIYGVEAARADDPAAPERLADDLGVALQLTNILRDIVEDRDQLGRVYLPRADLERARPGRFA
jgi:phytoene synthase